MIVIAVCDFRGAKMDATANCAGFPRAKWRDSNVKVFVVVESTRTLNNATANLEKGIAGADNTSASIEGGWLNLQRAAGSNAVVSKAQIQLVYHAAPPALDGESVTSDVTTPVVIHRGLACGTR
jgi:hypothetical protein